MDHIAGEFLEGYTDHCVRDVVGNGTRGGPKAIGEGWLVTLGQLVTQQFSVTEW